jgi:hypothetical protein
MKKYKLIQEYPGSPPLGAEVNELSHVNIADYPQFWEEVIEEKLIPEGWEIVEFERTELSSQTREGEKFRIINANKNYSSGSCIGGWTLKEMLKCGECYEKGHFIITEVRDTVTGVSVKVGDVISCDSGMTIKVSKIYVGKDAIMFVDKNDRRIASANNKYGTSITLVNVSYDEKLLSLNDLLEVWDQGCAVSQDTEIYEQSPLFQSFKQKSEQNKWSQL